MSAGLAAPASASLQAAGPINPTTGFPDSYTDSNGLGLQLCIDGSANCGAVAASELQPPDGEAPYWSAESNDVALPGGGTATLSLAVEAAYAVRDDGSPTEVVFSRVRVVFKGQESGGQYTVRYPFGEFAFSHDPSRRNEGADTGCDPAAPGEVCNFDTALGAPIGPFLTADPAVSPPPTGYVGDGANPVKVVGSPPNTNGDPAGFNRFEIAGPGGTASTDLFIVSGRRATDPVPVFAAGDVSFGAQRTGTSATKKLTIRNNAVPGPGTDVTVNTMALGGGNAADYALTANTCSGKTLASGQSCTADVRFTPAADGARTASVTVGTTEGANATSRAVGLSGDGFTPAPPATGATGALPAGAAPTIVQLVAPSARPTGSTADTRAPRVSFRRATAKLKGRLIGVTVSSDERALASVSGTVGTRGSARLTRLRGSSRSLRRGASTTVNLQVPKSGLKSLRKALKAGSTVQVRIVIRIVDATGNSRRINRTLRLT